jgi:hypothetical protein
VVLLGVIVGKPERPRRFPPVNEIERGLPDVSAIAAFSTIDLSAPNLENLEAHLVRVADVYVTTVFRCELIGNSTCEFTSAESAFVSVIDSHLLSLPTGNLEPWFDALDVEVLKAHIPIPI